MFRVNSINVSVQWLGVPDFLMTDGPPWTDNILDIHPSWGELGSSTNPNWGSQFGVYSDSVSVLWTRPAVSIQFTTIGYLKTRAALRAASVTISFKIIVRRVCKVPPLTATPYVVIWQSVG